MREQAIPELHHLADLLPPFAGTGPDPLATLRASARWIEQYTTRPHPQLGRSGVVCPWVEVSIRERRLQMLLLAGTEPAERVDEVFRVLRDRMLQPTQSSLDAMVVVFEGVSIERGTDLVTEVHERLKPDFIGEGLMLGDFYPSCDKRGLHNPDFRPLTSPNPLLVVRHMVPVDVAFLSDDRRFVDAFVRHFGDRAVDHIRKQLQDASMRLPPDRIALLAQVEAELAAAR